MEVYLIKILKSRGKWKNFTKEIVKKQGCYFEMLSSTSLVLIRNVESLEIMWQLNYLKASFPKRV